MNKLAYYLTKAHFRRGNLVYRKGDDCKCIYIVFEGEFELIKTVKLAKEHNSLEKYNKKIYDLFVTRQKRMTGLSNDLQGAGLPPPIRDPRKGFQKKQVT